MFITKKKLDQMLEDERRRVFDEERQNRNEINSRRRHNEDYVYLRDQISYLKLENDRLKELVVALCDKCNCQDLYAGKLVVGSRQRRRMCTPESSRTVERIDYDE